MLQEDIRIESEKVEMKRELEEERIMNIDMSNLSYKQQQYYERRQDEILAKHMNNLTYYQCDGPRLDYCFGSKYLDTLSCSEYLDILSWFRKFSYIVSVCWWCSE
jgi:hypothetical protein